MVDLEGIEDHLRYDPETGLFHWLARGKGRRLDLLAGTLDYYGYTIVRYKGKPCPAHRLAFYYETGKMPKDSVDHINGVRDDNRWLNLREATHIQNMRNMRAKLGYSKYKSVTKNGSGWRARIASKVSDRKTLGTYLCEKEAALAYNYAALEHFGSFARLNQVFE
jgi:hypothetical protein